MYSVNDLADKARECVYFRVTGALLKFFGGEEEAFVAEIEIHLAIALQISNNTVTESENPWLNKSKSTIVVRYWRKYDSIISRCRDKSPI